MIVDVSSTSYIPAEYRQYLLTGKIEKLGPGEFVFSKEALLLMRDQLLGAVLRPPRGSSPNASVATSASYIRRERHGNERKALNSDEAEKLPLLAALKPVEPGNMTLVQQINLFVDAQVIVGQISAALTNLLFAGPRCKVVAMAPYYPNTNYYFWSNFLGLLGHDLIYVLGNQVDGPGHVFHRSYRVDMKAFGAALDQVCQ